MLVALTFAAIAAVLLGASDFWAARSARTTPSITVTRTAVAVSTLLAPLLIPLVPFEIIRRDLLIAAIAGLGMTTGLMLLYRGYATARIGVVAPMSSVILAAVPVLWDLVQGQRPSALGSIGMVVGVAALVLTSFQPGGSGSVRLGALLGISSGALFGAAFTLMGEVSKQSGLVPVIAQRATGFALVSVVALRGSQPFFATAGAGRRAAIAAGVFGVTAIAALQLAFQNGASGPVAVAASQFATVAVILSVLFNGERMRWWQAVGVGATAVGVSLMALG